MEKVKKTTIFAAFVSTALPPPGKASICHTERRKTKKRGKGRLQNWLD
jgi:hypothetical protein